MSTKAFLKASMSVVIGRRPRCVRMEECPAAHAEGRDALLCGG